MEATEAMEIGALPNSMRKMTGGQGDE